MATDSEVAVRFVAAPDHWDRRSAAIRGIAIHMAEGGGTVSWLTRNDGNSSHYVVEYDGEVVQMVREARAAGSLNPTLTRKTDDAPFRYLGETIIYGRTSLAKCLGPYVTDPNRVAIAIEVEGFAATGPNAKQRTSLVRLIRDIRARRGALPCFGHRDQQSYKRCPGKRIPWPDYGGHAVKTIATSVTTTEETGMAITGSLVPEVPTQVTLKADASDPAKSRWLYRFSDHRADSSNVQLKPNRPLFLTRFVDADTYAVAYEPSAPDANDTSREMFVKSGDIASTAPYAPPTTPDPELIEQAKADGYADGYATAKARAVQLANAV